MNHVSLARICYDAVRAYGRTHGERYLRWDDATTAERESFANAVAYLLEAPTADMCDLHGHWLASRAQRGWTYGAKRNDELREHPAMVPWENVPERQRLKFEMFWRIVDTFRDHVVPRLRIEQAPD